MQTYIYEPSCPESPALQMGRRRFPKNAAALYSYARVWFYLLVVGRKVWRLPAMNKWFLVEAFIAKHTFCVVVLCLRCTTIRWNPFSTSKSRRYALLLWVWAICASVGGIIIMFYNCCIDLITSLYVIKFYILSERENKEIVWFGNSVIK